MRSARSLLKATVLGTALVAALGGCASIKDHRGYIVDAALVDSVQPGIDNRESVERTLGRPTFVSEFGRKDWYYVSQNTKQAAFTRPRANEQLILRVRFDEQGNVAGLDRAGLEKVARLDPDGKKTPTLGRNRTFIEDLFGNIGTVGAGAAPGGGGGRGGGPNGS